MSHQPPATTTPAKASDTVHDFTELALPAQQLSRSIACVLLVLVALIVWAASARLDVVSIAPGEVIPADKVQSIAHLEGGVIRQVFVKQGQRVQAGEPLLELESTASGASVAELGLKLASLQADLWRIDAELVQIDDLTAPQPAAAAPDIAAQLITQAQVLFRARRDNLRADIEVQAAEITRRQQNLSQIQARLSNQQQRLVLLDEQIAISAELVQQAIASRYEHINLLKEASSLRSQIAEDEQALLGAQAEINQAKAAADNILVEYQQALNEARDEAARSYSELAERYKKFADDLSRTVLTAPVSGLVKQVYVFTVGGVVGAGQTVLDIVPDQSRVIIEAKLPPQDIGYVKVGAKALIRLNSADASQFEALAGEVITISPDTVVDDQGNAYYVTQIATEKDYFSSSDGQYPLVPGVMVTSGLVLGQRSILAYVFSPFISSSAFALSER